MPVRVSDSGRLDLDDIGAEVSQYGRRRRRGDEARAVDHHEPAEDVGRHLSSLSDPISGADPRPGRRSEGPLPTGILPDGERPGAVDPTPAKNLSRASIHLELRIADVE